jgi:hypothetical protein
VLQEGHYFSSTRDSSDATKYRAIGVECISKGLPPALAEIGNGTVADGADVIELKKSS